MISKLYIKCQQPELLDELQGEHDEELEVLQLEDELELELQLELWLHEQLEDKLQELEHE